MDQNWNNGAFGNSMPAPNMGMDPNSVPNNGMNMNQSQTMNDPFAAPQAPQMPQMTQEPNMQAPQMPQMAQNQSTQTPPMPTGQPMQASQAPQAPQVAPPNMNTSGSAPVLNQPGVPNSARPAKVKSDKGSLVETLILVAVCLVAAAAIIVAVIFFMKYNEVNEDQEAKTAAAVAEAVAAEQEAAAKTLEEKLKEPNLEFRGPEDYGSISFQYPKTWSVYVNKDATKNGDYEALFNPKSVPSLSNENSRYALRFAIYNRQYADVAKQYLNKKELSSESFETDGGRITGTRYQGQITSKINGTFVLFKVNDKTGVLQTDSDVLLDDYEAILKTLRLGTD